MPVRQVSVRDARRTSALLAALLAVSLSGCLPAVEAASTAEPSTLEVEVARAITNDYERAAVAVIQGGEVSTVFVRADEETAFEIGSITKLLTGELLAIAIERGEVGLDDPLGAYLPLGDAPVASVTLRSLATHRSGLPIEPTEPVWAAAEKAEFAAGGNSLEISLDELLALARLEPIVPSEELVYSNLGAALLGHALAAAAGTDYRTLLESRVLAPLGMDGAELAEAEGDVPAGHAGGHDAAGQPVGPWWSEGFGPAGFVHATLGDLVVLAQAVLDGPLADSAALEPIAPGTTRFEQLGYFWWVIEDRPRTLWVHEGGTGGFRSALLIDRDAGIASIVLLNSLRDPVPLAKRFLVEADDHG